MLRFQLPILANHWRGVTSSHDGANALLSLSGGVATAVCESEEAYIVSNERASTVIVATAVDFFYNPETNNFSPWPNQTKRVRTLVTAGVRPPQPAFRS